MDLAQLSVSFQAKGVQQAAQEAGKFVDTLNAAENAANKFAKSSEKMEASLKRGASGGAGKDFISTFSRITAEMKKMEQMFNQFKGFQSFYKQLDVFQDKLATVSGKLSSGSALKGVDAFRNQIKALESSMASAGRTGSANALVAEIAKLEAAIDKVGVSKRGTPYKNKALQGLVEEMRKDLNHLASEALSAGTRASQNFNNALKSFGMDGKQQIATRVREIVDQYRTLKTAFADNPPQLKLATALFQEKLGVARKEYAAFRAEMEAKAVQATPLTPLQNSLLRNQQLIKQQVPSGEVYQSTFGGVSDPSHFSKSKVWADIDAAAKKAAESVQQSNAKIRQSANETSQAWAKMGLRPSAEIRKDIAQIEAAMKHMATNASAADFSRFSVKAREDIAKLNKEMAGTAQQSQSMWQRLNHLFQNVAGAKSLGQVFANTAMYSGMYRVLSVIMEMPGAILDANAKMEMLRKSFTGIFGSESEGIANFEYIVATANKFGKEIEAVAGGYRKFAAATDYVGMSTDKTRQIFEAVTAAVTKMGGSSDDIGGTLTALTQMISKGTVSAEEFRLQFAERIPGAMKMGADAMGVSVAQFKKMMADGALESVSFLEKFTPELEKFAKGWETTSDTMSSNVARMKNALMELFDSAAFQESASSIVKSITSIIKETDSFLKTFANSSKGFDLVDLGMLSYSSFASMGKEELQKFLSEFDASTNSVEKRLQVFRDKLQSLRKQDITTWWGGTANLNQNEINRLDPIVKDLELRVEGVPAAEKAIDTLVQKLAKASTTGQGDVKAISTEIINLQNWLFEITGRWYEIKVTSVVDTTAIDAALGKIDAIYKGSKLATAETAKASIATLESQISASSQLLQQKQAALESLTSTSQNFLVAERTKEEIAKLNEGLDTRSKLLIEVKQKSKEAEDALIKQTGAANAAYNATYKDTDVSVAKLPYRGNISQENEAMSEFTAKWELYSDQLSKGRISEEHYWTKLSVISEERKGKLEAIVKAENRAKAAGAGAAKSAALQENAYGKLLDKLKGVREQLEESLDGDKLGAKIAKIGAEYTKTMHDIEAARIKGQDVGDAEKEAGLIKSLSELSAYKGVYDGLFPSKKEAENLQSIVEKTEDIAQAMGLSAEQTEQFKRKLFLLIGKNNIQALEELAEAASTFPEMMRASNAKMAELTKVGGVAEKEVWDNVRKNFEENSSQMYEARTSFYDKMVADAQAAGSAELAAFAQMGKEENVRKHLEQKTRTGSPSEAFAAQYSLDAELYKSAETRKRESAVESAKIFKNLQDDVAGSFASGIGDMIRGLASGTMNMEDVWKSFLASIVDAFASAIESMIANWLKSGLASLFSGESNGSVGASGGSSSGGGLGDIFSKLIEPAASSLFNGAGSAFSGGAGLLSSVGSSVGAGAAGTAGGIFSGAGSAVSSVTSSVMGIAGGAATGAAMGSVIPVIGTLIGAGIGILGGLLSQGQEEEKPPQEVWSGRSYMYGGGAMSGFKATQMDDGTQKYEAIDPFELEQERREFKETARSFSRNLKTLEIDHDPNWVRSFSFASMPVPDELASSVQHVMMQAAGQQAMGTFAGAVGLFSEGLENLVEVVERLGDAFSAVVPVLGPLGVDMEKMSGTTDAVIMSYAALATGFNGGLLLIGEAVANQVDSTEELSESLLAVGAAGQRTVEYFESYRKQLSNLILAQYSELLINAVGGEESFKQTTTTFSNYAMGDRERAESSIDYYTDQFSKGVPDLESMLPNFDGSWIGESTDAFWKAYSAAMKESMPPSMFAVWSDVGSDVAGLEDALQALEDVKFTEWAWDEELKYRRQMADEQKAGAEMTRWGIQLEQELADARKNGATYTQQIALVETQVYELEAKLKQLRGEEVDSDDLETVTGKLSKAVSYQIDVLSRLASEAYAAASAFESLGESLRDAIESLDDTLVMPKEQFIKDRSEFNTNYSQAMDGYDDDAQKAMGKLSDLASSMLESAKKSMSYDDYNILEARTLSRLRSAASRSELQGEYGEVSGDIYTAEGGLLSRLQEELQQSAPDLEFVSSAQELFKKIAAIGEAAKDTSTGDMSEATFAGMAKSTAADLMTTDLSKLLKGTLDLQSVSQNQARLMLSSVDTLEALEKYTGQEIDLSDSMRLQLETIAAGVSDQSMWQEMIDKMEEGKEEYISWIEENIASRKAEADRLYALQEKEAAASDQMLVYFSAMAQFLEKQTQIETISASMAALQSKASSVQNLAMMAMLMGAPMVGMMHMQMVTEINAQIAALREQLNSWASLVVDIPEFALGGLVTERTLATVGEAGPEAIVPLQGGAIPVRINNPFTEGNEALREEIAQMRVELVALSSKIVDNTKAAANHTYSTARAIERSNLSSESGTGA